MLTFVGLGLYDERSITVAGRDAVRSADRAFAEAYTSRLVGADLAAVERFHDIEIERRSRAGVEQDPSPILDAAADGDAVFLTAGDTMISTTHVDLRLRAHERGIDTRVIHGTTAQTAASGLTGLQNYRFGKATTLPFAYAHAGAGVPDSVVETIGDNADRGLHTLVYLDIRVGDDTATGPDRDGDEYMTASRAAERLAERFSDRLAVGVARAGAPDPFVRGDTLSALAEVDFGDPLHLLVIPGDLHHVEADALAALADAPDELLIVD